MSKRNSTLTHDRLTSLLNYDPNSGIFRWAVLHGTKSTPGKIAGTISDRGYRRIAIDGKIYKASRLAWFHVYGHWPNYCIDHINGQKDDDRLINLRDITGAANMQNQHRPQSRNLSGYLGVSKQGNRYLAIIQVNRKARYLGSFGDPESAHAAYVDAKRQIHPHGTI